MTLTIAVSLTAVLQACDPEEQPPQPYSVTINNAEEFKSIADKLGANSAYGTFTLNSDINLGSDFTTLGGSVDSSFRGVLDGGGHTVTYTLKPEPAPSRLSADGEEEEYLPAETRYWGLFGYLYNATVKNLEIKIEIEATTDSEVTYTGGLAAFAYGSVKLENISVSGDITLYGGNLAPYNAAGETVSGYKLTSYVGGMLGYAEGDLLMQGVSTDVGITLPSPNTAFVGERNWSDDVYAGGVAGLIRTENNTSEGKSFVAVSGVTSEGDLEVYGGSVKAGGIFGLAQRTNITSSSFSGSVDAHANTKLYAGGVAGALDIGKISESKVGTKDLAEDVEKELSSEEGENAPSTSFAANIALSDFTKYFLGSVGGIVGLLSNASVEGSSAYVALEIGMGLNNYSGGIAGQVYFSDVTNCAAGGSHKNSKYTNFTRPVGNTETNEDFNAHLEYAASGGIAGRIYGRSKFDKVVSAMKGVYQGIAGEIVDGIETVILENGESMADRFPGYTEGDDYTKIEDTEDGIKYSVTHKPTEGEEAYYSYSVVESEGFLGDNYYDYYAVSGRSEYPGAKAEDILNKIKALFNQTIE